MPSYLPHRVRHRRKPTNPRIDWSHPLSRGLRLFVSLGSLGFARNLANPANQYTIPNSSPSVSTTSYGRAIYFPEGAGDFELSYGDPLFDLSNFTLISSFKTNFQNWNANNRGLIGKGTGGQSTMSYAMLYHTTGDQIRIQARGTSQSNFDADDAPWADGSWHSAGGTYDGSRVEVFTDGRNSGGGAYTQSLNDSSSPLLLGDDPTHSSPMIGDMLYAAVWDRALPVAVVESLTAHPLALSELLQPERRYYPVPTAAPPASGPIPQFHHHRHHNRAA